MKKYFSFLLAASFLTLVAVANPPGGNDSIKVAKIWDAGQHNAFTDLIRFNNQFYCSFREGASHVGGNGGSVRIISSEDGVKWESVALLTINGLDLRDPKLSIMPGNKLMVIMAGAIFSPKNLVETLNPMVSFSDKSGKNFSLPEKCVLDPSITPSRDWMWRVTWHKGVGYGINYQIKENGPNRSLLAKDAWRLYLMKTTDGKHFQNVSHLNVMDLPNESTVRFDKNDHAFVLVRREAGDKNGVLLESSYPYKDWKYDSLNYRLGGPNFLFSGNDKLLIGTRLYESPSTTGVLVTDLHGRIEKTIPLPSKGDASYPGMVMYKNKLWVSYYASHEGKTSIYLAQVPAGML